MGIRRRPPASSTRSSGSTAIAYAPLLAAGFALVAATVVACAGSDQQMTLQRELDAALAEKSEQPGAQCHPGVKEQCYSGPEGSSGRGHCAPGTRECDVAGQWGVCQGEVLPSARELCNDIDDDCNGVVDDGFQRAGTQCWLGEGECKSKGVHRCSADGSRSECDAAIIKPQAETCDGKDNNCNGQIDEGTIQGTGDVCSTGRAGACNPGHRQCVAGEIRCAPDNQPGIEVCNKIDDDCDNEIDEECVTEEEARKIGSVK